MTLSNSSSTKNHALVPQQCHQGVAEVFQVAVDGGRELALLPD